MAAMTTDEQRTRRRMKRVENQQAAYQSVKSEIVGVWRDAAKHGDTHQTILERTQRILGGAKFATLPHHLRSQIRGVQDAMFDLHYRDVLVFTHVIDGVRYDAWHPTFSGRFSEVDQARSDHCYRVEGRYVPFHADQRERDDVEGIESAVD